MDRRQRRTREAIFSAFTQLLAQKDFAQITVGQIIEKADVGRATFYAHFETKEFLLTALCEELFAHVLPESAEKFASYLRQMSRILPIITRGLVPYLGSTVSG